MHRVVCTLKESLMRDKTAVFFLVLATIFVVAFALLVVCSISRIHGQTLPKPPVQKTSKAQVTEWLEAKRALRRISNPMPSEIKQARALDVEVFARMAEKLGQLLGNKTADETWEAWFDSISSYECRGMKFPAWSKDIVKTLVESDDFDVYLRNLLDSEEEFLILPLLENEQFPIVVSDFANVARDKKPRIIGVKIVRFYLDATCYYAVRWNVPPKTEERIVMIPPLAP